MIALKDVKTADEYREAIRANSRARSKQYYENHKAEVLARQKARRDRCRAIVEAHNNATQEKQEKQEKQAKPAKQEKQAKQETVNKQSLEEFWKTYDGQKSSTTNYKSHANAVIKIVGNENLQQEVQHMPQLISKLLNAKKPNGEKYATNTIKAYLQAVLILIDNDYLTTSKANRDILFNQFGEIKIQSNDENKQKMSNLEVPRFQD